MSNFAPKTRGCVSAAVGLGPEDTARFIELHDSYVVAGMEPMPAAVKAANDLVAEIEDEAKSLSAQVEGLLSDGQPKGTPASQPAPAPQASPSPPEPSPAASGQQVPAAPVKKTEPMSEVIDAVNKKHGAGLTDADRVPEKITSKTPTVDAHTEMFKDVRAGTATPEGFKAIYRRVRDGKDAIVAELNTSTKDELQKGISGYLRPGTTKGELIETIYGALLRSFALGKSFGPNGYVMGQAKAYEKAKQDALDALVEGQTAESLAEYAAEAKAEFDAEVGRRAALVESFKDPKTLEDFRAFVTHHMREGKTNAEARMMLTPEQRATYDSLSAADTRGKRKQVQDDTRSVRVAGQTVDGEIIATKHTKKGHDLFVVKLSERVSRDDYDTLNVSAKRMGGYYSSFRGGGAIAGFQFTDRAQAEAFVKLAQGDMTDAQAVAQERRDAFADDRSQTAVQRLTEMADRLEERADDELSRDRKTNTAKRAGQAAGAEAAARSQQAMAKTMRNIAAAIEAGTAQLLDRVRQKVQVELLAGEVRTAADAQLRAEFPSYADQEKHRGRAPTPDAADFATFPAYTAYRSDLASLARQMLEVDGTKLLGQRILKVADDVSDAFLEFAKEPGNFNRLAIFSTQGGSRAGFSTKDSAEAAIARSGYKGKAIPFTVKRGEHTIILSPSEAMARGIWNGDGDKRITLTPDLGVELVEKIGRANRRGARVSVPWQFESAYDKRKVLARMGIETAPEYRSALREFIGLREQPEAADKVKQLERAMVGRSNDGLDFFPTPAETADEMVAAAGIEAGMRVLEPSAGWGHIAERIRAAGAEPDVVEVGNDRRELLEAKGFNVVGNNFLDMSEAVRGFTYGDLMESPDGKRGILRGLGGLGSDRVRLVEENDPQKVLGYYDFAELTGVKMIGPNSGYDRILMNPPFSDGRDIQHVRHAFGLLKPGGRLVAIMGESAFTNQNKRATEFRSWLESVGGTDEKLAGGTFQDPLLPVTTGANARMVVIEKAEDSGPTAALKRGTGGGIDLASAQAMAKRLADAGLLKIGVVANVDELPAQPKRWVMAQSPDGAVRGAYIRGTDQVWLFTDHISSADEFVFVALHEAFHRGLANTIPEAKPLLREMHRTNAALRTATAAQMERHNIGQDEAIEEALADMAGEGTARDLTGWDKLLQLVRDWLGKVASAVGIQMTWTDDMVQDFVAGIRRAGLQGGVQVNRVAEQSPAMLSRAPTIKGAFEAGLNRAKDFDLVAQYKVGDLLEGAGRVSWWHKTVGTMSNLAKRSPFFNAVYQAAQRFISDASLYAAEAAELAPDILPKLDKATDALPAMRLFGKDVGKSPLSAEDTAAVSKPVFDGTLKWGRDTRGQARPMADIVAEQADMPLDDKAHQMLRDGLVTAQVLRMWQGQPQEQYEAIIKGKFDREYMQPGVVFTPSELRQHFNLDDRQIGLYQQARKAIDKSLNSLSVSQMLKQAGDVIPSSLRTELMDGSDAATAAQRLTDYLGDLADADPDREDSLRATIADVQKIAEQTKRLIKQGYAPLSRFGEHTLEATTPDGERYFSLVDTARARNRQARLLAEAGATGISTGTLSKEEYKLLQGVSPESLALFGEILGLDSQGSESKDVAYQAFLRRAVASQSALKRLMQRKGVAGYSEDVGRVLASFIYSNGRLTSGNLHKAEMLNAVEQIPKEQGQLKDAAVKLREYVQNPQEEAAWLRGLLFSQYIGGSIASAMVNATQPFTMTFPWLSQYGGVTKAGKQMLAALKDVRKSKTGDAALDAALRHAEEEGTVSPQEIHALQAQAMGKAQLEAGDGTKLGNTMAMLNNARSKGALAWGKMFSLAEQFNRRVTFIAAYRTAVEQGMSDPAAFAKQAVEDTQGVYTKANKPQWARGAVGSVLFTFKQYSIAYVEMLHRMATAGEPGSPERAAGRRAALLALAVLFLMAGGDGLPFAEDVQDIIDAALQRMGYNFSSKQAKKEFLARIVGHGGAEFLTSGISGLPGAPIDVSGRMSMGNLLPGTGLFKKKPDHTRDVMEFVGPAGDLAKRTLVAADQVTRGEFLKARLSVAPVALRNVAQAIDMTDKGMYRDDRGRKVIDTTGGEAIAKGLGFQPRSVKEVQEATMEAQRAKSLYSMAKADIHEKWAKALFDGDQKQVQEARDDVATWNRKNPEQPMKANMPAVLKRVREMRMPKAERVAATAPKAIRAQVKAQIAEELR